ncbi:secretory phospholipase A2 receptor isoform X2 [Lates calcarifer]|nr:secretory phospholipase A2 receptor isoform X2 [Lates calcarifer]
MKRNIISLLLFNLVLVVLLTPPHTVNIVKVVNVHIGINWTTANSYCRAYYTDLVTIRNAEDNMRLAKYSGWIGLHYGEDGVWVWASEHEGVTFVTWDGDIPDDDKQCVMKYGPDWVREPCRYYQYSLCMDESLILVQEMKTWEEALQYCRELQAHTRYRFDLVSLPEKYINVLDGGTKKLSATTDEVWVGLRFQAGKWFWLDGSQVTSSYLPHCPVQQQHCGALVYNSTNWKTLNCSEKRKFLCGINN